MLLSYVIPNHKRDYAKIERTNATRQRPASHTPYIFEHYSPSDSTAHIRTTPYSATQ